jgi:hypothetical protein
VPGVPDWDGLPAPAPDDARLKSFFDKYELHRFAAETAAPPPAPRAPKPAAPPRDDQMSLF